VIWNIDKGKKNTQIVFALQIANARVDVLGMQTVIFETRWALEIRINELGTNSLSPHLRNSTQVVNPTT
jgi:hypothetical protein